MKIKTSLQFINHASILVKHGDISLLSDPWYQGDAFHKGWKLIHELKDQEINSRSGRNTRLEAKDLYSNKLEKLFKRKFIRRQYRLKINK